MNIPKICKILHDHTDDFPPLWECSDKAKSQNDLAYQKYLNKEIDKNEFEKELYNNILKEHMWAHPVMKEDMWKEEMLRLLGDNVEQYYKEKEDETDNKK